MSDLKPFHVLGYWMHVQPTRASDTPQIVTIDCPGMFYPGATEDRLAKDLAEARTKLQHVCEIMATLNEPGLKDVLLEMHAYLFPEAIAVRIAAQEKTL